MNSAKVNKPSKNVKKTMRSWRSELKSTDTFIPDPRATDVIIPVIGITGVGKSSFINTLLGELVASVGHTLNSHTQDIQHFVLPHPQYPNRRVIIIDTPGFDHTNVDDKEILRRIAVWLAQSYDANMKLAGIIYLHEISQTHMPPVQRNLDLFTKLCGPGAIKNVVLATTKWTDVPKEVGEHREVLLKERHWKSMISLGSTLFRFEETQESARTILHKILAQKPLDAVQIQKELVDLDRVLVETEAGRSLYYSLHDLLEIQKKAAARLQAQEDARSELHLHVAENDHKIRAILGQIKDMNVELPRKFMRWIGL